MSGAIRFATRNDCGAVLRIYAQYIDTPVTFECSVPSERDFSERISAIAKDYPFLVYEENGEITGYAYAVRLKEREAYQWDAELSVYFDKEHTGKGLGKKLYSVLIEILKLQGIKTVYGSVTAPNPPSEKMHASMGFRYVCTFKNQGYKCGKWHDGMWFEKQIAPYDCPPSPMVSIGRIPSERLREAMEG